MAPYFRRPQLSALYGCERRANTYIPHVVDVDGRLVVLLALDGLGLVGIVFYGPDYPGAGVSVSGLRLCVNTTFLWSSSSSVGHSAVRLFVF